MEVDRSPNEHAASRTLFVLSVGVFLIGGFLSSTISLLVPRLIIILGLDYARALLVQFAYHISCLIFAVPVAFWIVRVGHMRSMATGLWVMVAGCLVLTMAGQVRSLALVLLALVILSMGMAFLQITANLAAGLIGKAQHSVARLTMLQGFNSIGTVAGPLVAAVFLLSSVEPRTSASQLWSYAPFLMSALLIAALAFAFTRKRDMLGPPRPEPIRIMSRKMAALIASRRMLAGTCAMFAYVGTEVTLGTLLPNFLMLDSTIHARPVIAGQLTSLYWFGAMIGRFAGAHLLRRWNAGLMLAMAGTVALALVIGGSLSAGVPAASMLIAVGLCNSIMYPTIYALTLPPEETEARLGSMLLCMAVAGGAVIPLLTGMFADHAGLAIALLLPAGCYGIVAAFGWQQSRSTYPRPDGYGIPDKV